MTSEVGDRGDIPPLCAMKVLSAIGEPGKATGAFAEPVRGERVEDDVATESPSPNVLVEFVLAVTQMVGVCQATENTIKS
jgi:hypothetical protein